MTFKSFRDKLQWVALALARVLFIMDWLARVHYVAFVDNQYIDSTPRIVNQVWLLLVFSTLIVGLLSFPRLPSFLALLSFCWVIFLSIQGH
jgi:hypothetical protein